MKNVNKNSGSMVKPPLKWAGGKRWLVPYLRPYWKLHEEKRFVEPFCGGLAVSLGLLPKKAWLNDINPHVINFYNQIKAGLKVQYKLFNNEDHYYDSREKFNSLLERGEEKTPRTAELFYYLNRTGFNGLCRFNNKGLYNIPFGRNKTINYMSEFPEHEKIFKNWKFTSRDFEKMALKETDFVYADPPYDVPFTKYSTGGFSWDDQVRAAKFFAKHKGPVVLSNQATDRITELYNSLGFDITVLEAPRVISCTGDRKKVKEVVATKNLPKLL